MVQWPANYNFLLVSNSFLLVSNSSNHTDFWYTKGFENEWVKCNDQRILEFWTFFVEDSSTKKVQMHH